MPDAPLREAVEQVARVAQAKRGVLLRAYRHMLYRDDLEDCYSQATLELIARARDGIPFSDELHVANTLELRFGSRIRDLRRARGGRSPMQAAMASALSIDGPEGGELAVIDPRADLETIVHMRGELRRVQSSARQLSADQQLALACQLADARPDEVRRQLGWSAEKYRKAAQRGRSRLKALMANAEERPSGPASGAAAEQATGTHL
jgi:DNA-directed RNA polymerase specialized sigma24 family protein